MKRVIVLLVLLFLLAGCEKKETYSVAVLERSSRNDGIVVFLDADGEVLGDKPIGYPYEVYFGPDAVYYTVTGGDYQSFRYRERNRGDELKNIRGTIVYHSEKYGTIEYIDSCLYMYDPQRQQINHFEIDDIEDYYAAEDRIFLWNSSNDLYCFALETGDLIYRMRGVSRGYVTIGKVAGQYYLVDENGYTLLGEEGIGYTYVYPMAIEEVIGAYRDYLAVNENGETAVYKVSFDKYAMKLTPEYDEKYLDDLDFEKMYAKYYQQGYEVMAYWEVE
ncbi:MAG: hypothetical protein II161_01350 [Erysipelotrichaceae bacterium]|nr:hypothetical protein [Erysipelotrichaceae bacterium]